MSLRQPRNSNEARTALHAFYEPYAQGIVNFPRARIVGELGDIPEKTRPIAQVLIDEWAKIDAARKVHTALARNVLEHPDTMLASEDGSPARGVILSQIGRNTLEHVVFTPIRGKILMEHATIGPRDEMEDFLANHSVELADGRVITHGGFGEDQAPDIDFPVPAGDGQFRYVTHFDARATQQAA